MSLQARDRFRKPAGETDGPTPGAKHASPGLQSIVVEPRTQRRKAEDPPSEDLTSEN